ncbi:MAG TPA: hypothetical protein VNB94_01785 [Mycobacteriales bacterium]|nr:hypothetical protein [Mycobacteriales bacterium]
MPDPEFSSPTSGRSSAGAPVSATVGEGRRPVVRRPWPALPRWLVAGVAALLVVFVVLAAFAVGRILDESPQPLFERRSPSLAGRQSHDVGLVQASNEPPVAVRCGVVDGLQVAADAQVRPALVEALRDGLCARLGTFDDELARRVVVAARRGVVISFGVFARTGEDSTTLAGSPPRIVLNNRFAGSFKGFLLPLLAHELWHAGQTDVTAEEEYAAREIEDEVCNDQRIRTSRRVSRGCEDARAIVRRGRIAAIAELERLGYR